MKGTGRIYAGVPAGERAELRRQALLDAAFDIVGTRGAGSLTVGAMCRQSGVTERYYYALFNSLDEVIVETAEQQFQALRAYINDRAMGVTGSPRASMRAGITASIDWMSADPRRIRVLMTETLTHPALIARRGHVVGSLTALLLGVGLAQFGEGVWTQSADKAVFGALYMVGGFHEALLGWLNQTLPVSREVFIDMCTEMYIRTGEYVTGQTFE